MIASVCMRVRACVRVIAVRMWVCVRSRAEPRAGIYLSALRKCNVLHYLRPARCELFRRPRTSFYIERPIEIVRYPFAANDTPIRNVWLFDWLQLYGIESLTLHETPRFPWFASREKTFDNQPPYYVKMTEICDWGAFVLGYCEALAIFRVAVDLWKCENNGEIEYSRWNRVLGWIETSYAVDA